MIQLDRLHLAFDGQVLFTDLSVQLSEQRIGLLGFNGSGKSSLLRLLNGLLQPQQGRVLVHGQDAAQGPVAMSSTVGFIFQNPDHQLIFPTVLEELCFGLRNQGCSAKEAEQRAMELLSAHQRQSWAERSVYSLSEGQKQWLCIQAVLLLQPRLLVLDEPFSALDLPSQLRLQDYLFSLPQQLVMISHELELLQDFDRLLWLHQGQLIADGSPAELLPRYRRAAQHFARHGELPPC